MTTAIEQLIKMHDPRCISAESMNIGRGRAALTRDQILGAFAAAQHQHSLGLDILMTKYLEDCIAEQRVRAAINEWVHQQPHPDRGAAACQLALSIVLERNLPAQVAHIAALLRKYGPRKAQTRKKIEALKIEIKRLDKQRCQPKVSDKEYHETGKDIETITARIEHERAALRSWSEQQAANNNICPCCSGTGRVARPHPAQCEECGGKGKIQATMERLRKSMRIIGAEVEGTEWAANYTELINRCLNWLYVEESKATILLTERIKSELFENKNC